MSTNAASVRDNTGHDGRHKKHAPGAHTDKIQHADQLDNGAVWEHGLPPLGGVVGQTLPYDNVLHTRKLQQAIYTMVLAENQEIGGVSWKETALMVWSRTAVSLACRELRYYSVIVMSLQFSATKTEFLF